MAILVAKPLHDKHLEAMYKRYAQDYNWIHDNYGDLIKKYPEKYIAVLDKNVKYVSDTIIELVSQISVKGKQPTDYAIEFITKKQRNCLY
ncbi:MAG: DUF5678 domain-containing protein [Candidatus Bathyarchaeota archaeon]|nr:DUF5678 domain-containing protein [Candidatus Bathyarchaeota archaeon]